MRKIQSLKRSIATFQQMRGSSRGTFWKDLTAVDKHIEQCKAEIKILQNHLSLLSNPPELIQQLVASEIF